MIVIPSFFDSLHPCQESQILADFVCLHPSEQMLDVGCGSGYLSFYLSWKYPQCAEIVGIDIMPSRIEIACQHHEDFKHQFEAFSPIQFVTMDARTPNRIGDGFDVLVSNPPFFATGSSRLSPCKDRRSARQDGNMTLEELFECAVCQLRQPGRLYFVIPAQRMEEAKRHAQRCGMVLVDCVREDSIRKRSGGVYLIHATKRERI